MSVKLLGVQLRGKANEEHVRFQVVAACDLHDYVVADTSYALGRPSNKLRHMHWFDPYKVSAGDFVFLYTGPGTPNKFVNQANTTTHVFYWGLKQTVWNDDGDEALLFPIKPPVQRMRAGAK